MAFIMKKNRANKFFPFLMGVLMVTFCASYFSFEGAVTQTAKPQTFNQLTASTVSGESSRNSPFSMPIKGDRYEIFQPLYDMIDDDKDIQIIAHPVDILPVFEKRLKWVNTMVNEKPVELSSMAETDHARYMYLEMIKSHVTATVFNDAELSVLPGLGLSSFVAKTVNKDNRVGGRDWTFAGDTMTGWKRVDNVKELIQNVIKNNVAGDYLEAGVWRGGSSVFAKAVLSVYGEDKKRVSYVCDSFAGLPPGDKALDAKDSGWDGTSYLEVPFQIVANNFIKYGLLDSNVVFAKGFFNETMPPLSQRIESLSIIRADGDMYESTVDILYHLYDKLSIGGYVIMDDWFGFPSRTACEDFFEVHGISPEVVAIDNISAYWKKTEKVSVQYWRYQQSKFKSE